LKEYLKEYLSGVLVNRQGMTLIFFGLAGSLCLIWSSVGAAKTGIMELAPREWGSYRAKLPGTDRIRWNAEWALEKVEAGPPAVYTARDELTGEFGPENIRQSRVTEARFILEDGRIRMTHSLLTVRDPIGKVIMTLEKDFDYRLRVVRTVTVLPEEKKAIRDEFNMGSELVDDKEIASYLRGFPFPSPEEVAAGETGDPELEFKFLNQTPDTYSVTIIYQGIEDVECPAGKFSCHKLRLVPDLGILTFLGKAFTPDIYFWFAVDWPHFWVKYQGLEGDLSTPSIVSELVELQTGN
jgi:hypothetical protein